MRSYPIFLLALVAFLFVACEKDTLKTTDNNDFQQYLNEADQKLAEADALLAQDLYVSERSAVILPAESVNGLAKAIREAGPFGTVIVEGGMHYESATVKITHPVIILGEENEVAVIQSTTSPNADFPYTLDPAIYLDHARQVQIEGLHFVPDLATGQGGTAILVSNSDRAYIRDNDFSGFLQAVMVYASDFVRIHYNRAEGLFTEGFEGFN